MTHKFVFDVSLMDGREFICDKEPITPLNYPNHLRFIDPETGDVLTEPRQNVAWRRRKIRSAINDIDNGHDVRTTEELLAEVFHYEGTTVATLDGETA